PAPDGKWRLAAFEQTITYPWPLKVSVNTVDTQSLGDGMFITVQGTVSGNKVLTRVIESNAVLDVKGKWIGYLRRNATCGEINGRDVTFKWDPKNNLLPLLTGTMTLAEGEEEVEVSILYPSARGDRIVFDRSSPGQFILEAEAKVKPATYADRLQWDFEKPEGATVEMDPPDGRGLRVRITCTGLPYSNDEFGKKNITASLDINGCSVTAKKQIKIFYTADAANNPDGNVPNWYYYYKQTPAARPNGQTVNLEYGARLTDDCIHCSCPMIYKPMYKGGDGTITVCDLNSICEIQNGVQVFTPYSYDLPLLSRDLNAANDQDVGKFNGWLNIKYIALFASALIHENQHRLFDFTWRFGKSLAQLFAHDTDWDGIPDQLESGPNMRFDPQKTQTFFANHPVLKAIQYDEEWLAYEKQAQYINGTYDKYDWAYPGKQWPNP
ncbi:MAG: hypothetical protein JRJ85_16720, partial [Deltaproteobacteria bacterium]|nr:hypothetical protein [Deltaproteobacteria bacterium]